MSFARDTAKSPCGGCADRFFDGVRTCHCTCEIYRAFREERNRVYAEALKESLIVNALDDLRERSYHKRVGKKQAMR